MSLRTPIFLLALLPTLFATLATAQKLAISTSSPVCVIGAGVAGIGAARSLKLAGVPVVVLEARPRPGGRVWSADVLGKGSSGNEPVVIDLGAGWFEGDGPANPIYSLVKPYFGQTVVSDFNSGESYYTTGGDVAEPTADWEEFESGDLKTQQDAASEESPVPTLLTLINRATAAETAQEKLRRQWQATLQVANEYAADPAQLSGTQWDSAGRLTGSQRVGLNERVVLAADSLTYFSDCPSPTSSGNTAISMFFNPYLLA